MKLEKYLEKINVFAGSQNRKLKKTEMLDLLNIISDDILAGDAGKLHINTLISIRNQLLSEDELSSLVAQKLGRKGGKSKSEAKQRASRENGKLGGRPKKKKNI